MNECSNDAVRDVLPLLASGGHVEFPADAESHVASCDACREELALLKGARQALLRGPVVDVARIAAAVPAYRQSPGTDPKIVPIASRRFVPRSWRIAAAALLFVAGGTVVAVRQASDGAPSQTAAASGETAGGAASTAVAIRPESIAQVPTSNAGSGSALDNGGPASGAEMTFGGGLDDLSDDDLVALLAALDGEDVLALVDPDESFPGVVTDSGEES